MFVLIFVFLLIKLKGIERERGCALLFKYPLICFKSLLMNEKFFIYSSFHFLRRIQPFGT